MKIFSLKKSDKYPAKHYKLVILNALAVSMAVNESMKGAVGIYIELLPLRLFFGFNISKRWLL
jgi:hypothetical protein